MPTTSYFWLLLRISPGCFFCLFLPMPFIQSLYILALPKLQTPRLQSHPLDESHGTKLGWLKASWHLEASRCQGSPGHDSKHLSKRDPSMMFSSKWLFLGYFNIMDKIAYIFFWCFFDSDLKTKGLYQKSCNAFLVCFETPWETKKKKKGNCRHLPSREGPESRQDGPGTAFPQEPMEPF